MAGIGEMLRRVRLQWGLSLRDVTKRSLGLADEWGNRSYEVSSGWLCKAERGDFEMTIPKLITLATIYSRPPEELFRHCLPVPPKIDENSELIRPNSTVLVSDGGLLDKEAQAMLPDGFPADPIPDNTTLLPPESSAVSPMRRAIIGSRDHNLYPMVRPGSILKIDTQKRAIASRREWTSEFDRPIYLLLTRQGLMAGWCDLDKDGTWLTLVTHNLSREPSQRWRYRKEVEVIGRAVAVAMRLTPATPATKEGSNPF